MLATITSAYFTALLDKTCWIEAANGELELTVASVREQPLAALQDAKRTPFIVLLHGPESPALLDGNYTLRVDGEQGWRLTEVFINRVLPSQGYTGACYQIVFN